MNENTLLLILLAFLLYILHSSMNIKSNEKSNDIENNNNNESDNNYKDIKTYKYSDIYPYHLGYYPYFFRISSDKNRGYVKNVAKYKYGHQGHYH